MRVSDFHLQNILLSKLKYIPQWAAYSLKTFTYFNYAKVLYMHVCIYV